MPYLCVNTMHRGWKFRIGQELKIRSSIHDKGVLDWWSWYPDSIGVKDFKSGNISYHKSVSASKPVINSSPYVDSIIEWKLYRVQQDIIGCLYGSYHWSLHVGTEFPRDLVCPELQSNVEWGHLSTARGSIRRNCLPPIREPMQRNESVLLRMRSTVWLSDWSAIVISWKRDLQ